MTTHAHLDHAPLTEALLEIQVPLSVDYGFVPGVLAQQLRPEFPIAERVNAIQLGALPFPTLTPNLVDVRLRSQDGRKIVQCGPQVVTVNMLAPYPGFGVFEKTIRRALEVFYGITRPQHPRRLGLRYINLIEHRFLEGTPVQAEAAFPLGVLPDKKAFAMRGVFPFPEAHGDLGIATANPQTISDGRTGFFLDLDFYNEMPSIASLPEILAWADRAHDVIHDAFVACVGERLLEKFGGNRRLNFG